VVQEPAGLIADALDSRVLTYLFTYSLDGAVYYLKS
jgi:hypothetical protein